MRQKEIRSNIENVRIYVQQAITLMKESHILKTQPPIFNDIVCVITNLVTFKKPLAV